MKKDRRPRMNARYTQISLYVIATCTILFLMMRIFDHGGEILHIIGSALDFLGVILVPILGGFAIAYILQPVVTFFRKLICRVPVMASRHRLTNSLATLVTYLLLAFVLFAALFVTIASITHQIRTVSFDDFGNLFNYLAESFSNIQNNLDRWIDKLPIGSEDMHQYLKKLVATIGSFSTSLGEAILGYAAGFTGFLTSLLFSLIFSVYFLLDGHNLARYWDKVLKTLTSRRFYSGFHLVLDDADKVFSSYIKGQLLDALILMFMVSIGLSIVGVKFAIVIGIITGIGNLIPYVGAFVAYIATILSCLVDGNLQTLVIATILICIFQFIDGNIINPKLLSNSIQIHPLLVICCLLIGGAFGGILGMIISVPVGAVLKIQFERVLHMVDRKRHGMSLFEDAGAAAAKLSKESADSPVTDPADTDHAATGTTPTETATTDNESIEL